MRTAPRKALRLIALYKWFKAVGLLLVAIASFGLVHAAYLDALAHWIAHLPIQHGHAQLIRLLDGLLGLGPRRFVAIGVAACVYAALFAVEGCGLWLGKRWAEYLTVVATASLIPFEVWEIFHRFATLKILALALNAAIVVYLIALLHQVAGKDFNARLRR